TGTKRASSSSKDCSHSPSRRTCGQMQTAARTRPFRRLWTSLQRTGSVILWTSWRA
ncbi:kif7, partial [Symbiodinium pilosum]